MDVIAALAAHLCGARESAAVVRWSTIDLIAALCFAELRGALSHGRFESLGVAQSRPGGARALADLLRSEAPAVTAGPVEYRHIRTGLSEPLLVPEGGLFLGIYTNEPVAVLFSSQGEENRRLVEIEVAAPSLGTAEAFMRRISSPDSRLLTGTILIDIDAQYGYLTQITPSLRESGQPARLFLPAPVSEDLERWGDRLASRRTERALSVFAFLGPAGSGKAEALRWLCEKAARNLTLVASDVGKESLGVLVDVAVAHSPAILALNFEDLDPGGPGDDSLHYLFDLLEQLQPHGDLVVLLSSKDHQALREVCASRPSIMTDIFSLGLPDAECRLRMLNSFTAIENREAGLTELIIAQTANMSRAFVLTFFERLSLFAKEHAVAVLGRSHVLQALKELEGSNKKDRFAVLGGQEFYDSFALLFDELKDLSDETMRELLREVPRDVLVAALAHAGEEVKERILSNVSQRGATMIREDLAELRSLTKERSLKAQQEIVSILRRVHRNEYDVIVM